MTFLLLQPYSTSAARGRQLVESVHDGGPSSRRASAGNILHKCGLYFPDIYRITNICAE